MTVVQYYFFFKSEMHHLWKIILHQVMVWLADRNKIFQALHFNYFLVLSYLTNYRSGDHKMFHRNEGNFLFMTMTIIGHVMRSGAQKIVR